MNMLELIIESQVAKNTFRFKTETGGTIVKPKLRILISGKTKEECLSKMTTFFDSDEVVLFENEFVLDKIKEFIFERVTALSTDVNFSAFKEFKNPVSLENNLFYIKLSFLESADIYL